MGEQRLHHTVTRAYLEGFCADAEKPVLHVHDMKENRWRPSAPENEARIRDFYRIDVPGADPNQLEKALGQVEGDAAGVLRKIRAREFGLSDRDMAALINFIGLAWVRTPQSRAAMEQAMKEQLQAHWGRQTESRETYSGFMQANGLTARDTDADFELAKALGSGQLQSAPMTRTVYAGVLLQTFERIIGQLAELRWRLFESSGDPFICSDAPVSTIPHPGVRPSEPGYWEIVVMPLSKDFAVVGRSADSWHGHVEASKAIVAWVNAATALSCSQRYVYAPTKSFDWQDQAMAIRPSEKLAAEWRRVATESADGRLQWRRPKLPRS